QRGPGGGRAHGRRRLGARDSRRARLRRQPVQPRHRLDAPARLLVQALRLRRRARARLQAHLDRGRRADLPRQLVPAELRPLLPRLDRKSSRLNSSHVKISYAVFCLKKEKKKNNLLKILFTTE